MKKALVKRADTRLVACLAASSFCCDHLARVGQVGGVLTTLLMSLMYMHSSTYGLEGARPPSPAAVAKRQALRKMDQSFVDPAKLQGVPYKALRPVSKISD
jgi:hypothetical protein